MLMQRRPFATEGSRRPKCHLAFDGRSAPPVSRRNLSSNRGHGGAPVGFDESNASETRRPWVCSNTFHGLWAESFTRIWPAGDGLEYSHWSVVANRRPSCATRASVSVSCVTGDSAFVSAAGARRDGVGTDGSARTRPFSERCGRGRQGARRHDRDHAHDAGRRGPGPARRQSSQAASLVARASG